MNIFVFFSLIERIIHEYIFLAKIIEVTGQNKVPFGYHSIVPCPNPNTSSNDLLKSEVQAHVVFEHDGKKKKACSNNNTNSLLLSRCYARQFTYKFLAHSANVL